MVTDGLIEVQDTSIIKSVVQGRQPQPVRPHEDIRGKAKLIRIYLGEADKFHGEPLYEAIVKRLRMMDVAGATVYRGILGYGAKRETHKKSLLQFSHDLPIMISVVEREERLPQILDTIESMMQDGLIVLSDVEVRRLVHRNPLEEEAKNAGTPAG
jgi:PII-like signaling protein